MYSSLFFSMTVTRGLVSGAYGLERPGLTDDEIRKIITTQVTLAVREVIPKMFGSFKTVMIELFDEHFAAVIEASYCRSHYNFYCYGSSWQRDDEVLGLQ